MTTPEEHDDLRQRQLALQAWFDHPFTQAMLDHMGSEQKRNIAFILDPPLFAVGASVAEYTLTREQTIGESRGLAAARLWYDTQLVEIADKLPKQPAAT